MSREKLSLWVVLSIISIVWASLALFADLTQRSHRDLVAALGTNPSSITLSDATAAIADIERALRVVPCNMPLSKQRVLLLAYVTDQLMRSGTLQQADDALDQTHVALKNQLSCTPMDGKAWLDFAIVTVHREGFSSAAAQAYAMSARVAPGESWLAQKRLEFALAFRPLLDASARQIAQHDIIVLQHAHPIRMQAILKIAGLESATSLQALFE